MKYRYLKNVVTLQLEAEKCNGCGTCLEVCPQGVFARAGKGAVAIVDRDACLECGACTRNCERGAVSVRAGVGCAYAVIMSKLKRKGVCCGGSCDCTIDDYIQPSPK
jgi:NAD-dependent dihydropyrimidine dehydrogenase PreA subunit